MIFDKIENLEKYTCMHPRFKKAFEWFRNADFTKLDFGKVIVEEGENEDANIRAHIDPIYNTRPLYKKDYEGHKKYIDVQIILEGKEECHQACLMGNEEINVPYNEANDIYKANAQADCEILLGKGNFAIFFPDDLHRPCVNVRNVTQEIRKVVLKIKID